MGCVTYQAQRRWNPGGEATAIARAVVRGKGERRGESRKDGYGADNGRLDGDTHGVPPDGSF